MKKVINREKFFLILIIILVFSIILGFGNRIQTGFVVADCIDVDDDGYYDEGCSLEDIGCDEAESLVVDSYDKSSLDIDENYLVYISNSGVYGYDLITSSNDLLNSGVAISNSRIDGSYVVWQTLESNYWQINMFDIDSLTSSFVSESQSHQITPDVYENNVVWADNVGGDWDIYIKDLITGEQDLIVPDEGNQYSPKIYGDYVVYVDDSSGTNDVYLYQISAEESIMIDGSDGNQNAVSIFENYVVWQSNFVGNYDLYLYDISTDEIIIVTDESYDEKYPRVSNNMIVWAEYVGNDYDIKYYDFETQDFYQLTDDGSNQIVPVVSSSYVIWLDDVNGYFDIFGQTVNPACDSFLFGDCDDSSNTVSPAEDEVCDDLIDNDCDGEIDEDCGVSILSEGDCLVFGVTSNVWIESTWNKTINSASDGDEVFLVSYGDGSCGTDVADFYLYSAVDDGDGTYVTDELVESFTSASIKNYDTYDASYTNWNAVYDSDKYYYFIGVLNETAVLSDTLLVCEADVICSGESITISDSEDYLALYSSESSCLTDDDCDSGETCIDGSCVESEIVETCEEEWDCSNVEWSECNNGISTLNLSQCLYIPYSDLCYTSDYLPETEKSCSSSVNAAEGTSSSEDIGFTEEEEVSVFTWINLLLVIGLLIGYYALRR